jgi:8-oxo-dGTP pyrophosphatase MutT (NUDIX family)
VSAVIGAVQINGKILAVKNPRGWDFPGGHVERNESPEEALARECLEEGAVTIANPTPVLTLEKLGGVYANKLMILYFADLNEILPFLPCEDSKAREILSLEEFQRRFLVEPNPCKEFLVGSKLR